MKRVELINVAGSHWPLQAVQFFKSLSSGYAVWRVCPPRPLSPNVRTKSMATALDYVQARAKREWDYTHSRGPFAWLFRRLGAMRQVRGVWIRQYRGGDWETVHCKGEVIQSWRYDADGLTAVDDVPELDKSSAIASTTPVISFCVDESAGRMIYQEWHGVRAGHGCILAHRGNGEWVTEKHGWIS